MAVAVIMPRQGNTVESCIITKWNKQVGDAVAVGDVLFSYETDKASFEEEAKEAGTMLAIFAQEGDDVPCLQNVCVIGKEGESFAEFAPGGAAAEAPKAEEAKAEAEPQQVAEEKAEIAEAPVAVGDLKISPRAKALAERYGADLSFVSATGPDGRVIARDVQALLDAGKVVSPAARAGYAGGIEGTGMGGRVTVDDLNRKAEPAAPAAPTAQAPAAEEETYTEPMTNIRKVIARSMTTSLNTIPQLTHTIAFDATAIQEARKLFKEKGEALGMQKININDMVMYAVARTLAQSEHRALNANLIDDGKTMKYFRHVNLGMACDTDRGLMVPTIMHAEQLSLLELSNEAKRIAKECKEGKINPDYLQGASFTVSNIGSLGIESFTPVVNPPQTGILGVCAITNGVRVENGEIKVYPKMNLSLSYDHRALDGTPASKFLVDLKNHLEAFTLMLAQG